MKRRGFIKRVGCVILGLCTGGLGLLGRKPVETITFTTDASLYVMNDIRARGAAMWATIKRNDGGPTRHVYLEEDKLVHLEKGDYVESVTISDDNPRWEDVSISIGAE